MTYLQSNLHFLRTKNKLSQKELAEKLFMTHQTISNHETGKSQPDLEMMQKYADFYEIPLSDLLHLDLSTKKPVRDIGNVIFDKDRQTFQILSGSKGIYPMKDVCKCQIVFEDAKYYGKTKPFSHRLLISSFESFFVTLRDTYVGLEIELKNKEKLYVYVSNIKQKHYSDAFKADVKVAETLKKYFKTIITGNKTMKDE